MWLFLLDKCTDIGDGASYDKYKYSYPKWESYEELNFEGDLAPSHVFLSFRAWLNNNFLARWIGRIEKENDLC